MLTIWIIFFIVFHVMYTSNVLYRCTTASLEVAVMMYYDYGRGRLNVYIYIHVYITTVVMDHRVHDRDVIATDVIVEISSACLERAIGEDDV